LGFDLLFKVLFSFSLFFLSSNDFGCLIDFFVFSGSSIWEFLQSLVISLLSFGFLFVFNLREGPGEGGQILVIVKVVIIGVIIFQVHHEIFFFLLRIDLMIKNWLIFSHLVFFFGFVLWLHFHVIDVFVFFINGFLIGLDLFAGAFLTFTWLVFGGFSSLRFSLLSFFLAGLLLNFKLRDFEGLDSGKKCLHLGVVFSFEVETHLNGYF
jgi:hypothetical protein